MKSKNLLLLFVVLSFVSISIYTTNSNALSRTQRRNADRIARVCSENYNKYGVLPSIAIAQAMQESSLGKHCPNYNMWGLASGRIYCSSVENGCLKYLKVINNGCYRGAPFCKNWRTQIRRILRGGYCQPVGSYYSCVVSIVNRYNLTKYDKKMFRDMKRKKEEEKKKKERRRRKIRLAKKKAEEKSVNRIPTETTVTMMDYTDPKEVFDFCYSFMNKLTIEDPTANPSSVQESSKSSIDKIAESPMEVYDDFIDKNMTDGF